jgi:NAD(P)-dependent dehydrogenase (short-subunit alcohol dehydrogenase family)
LVTGAARGIGASIAARLRRDGFQVVTLDVAPGCDLQVDLRDGDLSGIGDVDVCVSNAAITDTIAPAHRMTDEQWRRDVDVNLTGAFRAVRACLPGMRERGHGRVVVISSAAATGGLPGQAAYAASKAGLVGMVKTIAAENAGHGATVRASGRPGRGRGARCLPGLARRGLRDRTGDSRRRRLRPQHAVDHVRLTAVRRPARR